MRRLSITVISILITSFVFAQNNADSLYNVWQNQSQPDSNRIEAFHQFISKNLLRSFPDSAIVASNQLLEFSQTIEYKVGQAMGLNLLGIAHQYKSDFDKALEFNEASLKVATEIGYKKGIGRALGDIGTIYYNQSNYDKTYEFYHRSLQIRREIGDQEEISNSLNNLGVYYYAVSDYPRALQYFEESFQIREALGDKLKANRNLFNIAAIYSNQGDYLKALDYYERSLEITQELGDKAGIGNSLSQLGRIYNIQGSYNKALEYYQRSLEIREVLGNKAGIGNSLSSIGLIHKNQGNYDEAMNFLQQSITIREEVGDKRRISYGLNNIGEVYYEQGMYSTALDFFQRSLALKEEIGDKFGISYTLNNIGQLQIIENDYQRANQSCEKAFEISKEIGNVEVQKDACDCLYQVNKALNDEEKALFFLEANLILEDSLQSIETAKKFQQIEFAKQMVADSIVQAEKAKQVELEHQAEIQRKNRNRNIAVGAGLFFLILAGTFFGVWRYTQNSKVLIEKEKERSENLLLNILPAEVAEELKSRGRAAAKSHDLVSILFTDFKDFTKTSAELTAEDLVEEINTCFEAFDRIVEKYKIEKIKTIGDSYMAAGGLPISMPGAVKNTVLAALEMQSFIVKRKVIRNAKGQQAFQMRAGIHTGPVVAGIVGVKKFQYDVWGDTVNTASRMESNGAVDMVNISQATYEYLKNDEECEFENRGVIEVKGKEPMNMWFVRKKGES